MQVVVERSAETSGEHFTPPDVCRLVARFLLAPDVSALRAPAVSRTVLDPVCGTGGLLSEVEQHVAQLNPDARLSISGQELNGEAWAVCRSRMMLGGHDPSGIEFGNSLSDDRHPDGQFDYLLAVPPFGAEWRRVSGLVKHEEAMYGRAGRFGDGLPRINDSSLLFLQHMLSKMKPTGSRIAVVFTGAPMAFGGPGSGESEIRRWLIENDLLETVVALPDGIFHSAAIPTYLWTVTNRKSPDRQGKVVLLDARDLARQMRRPIGSKRRYFASEQIDEIVRLHGEGARVAADSEHPLHGKVRVLCNEELGYRQIIIERPLRLRFKLSEEAVGARNSAHDRDLQVRPGPRLGMIRLVALRLTYDEAIAWAHQQDQLAV